MLLQLDYFSTQSGSIKVENKLTIWRHSRFLVMSTGYSLTKFVLIAPI